MCTYIVHSIYRIMINSKRACYYLSITSHYTRSNFCIVIHFLNLKAHDIATFHRGLLCIYIARQEGPHTPVIDSPNDITGYLYLSHHYR